MRNIVILACVGLAAACTMNEPTEADRTAREALLSTALRDYEPAGPPVSCVQMRQLAGNKSAGDAIVFEGTTRERLWVNRPAGGCPDLRDRALVTRTSSDQLCRGDIATILDPVSRVTYGGCGLGDFQPYRRRPS
ncbi:MAG: hypothetical protein QOK17_2356 [Sphingomonadales bacterium]|jgi:hypothetical protein|nr:hypothetical protein [Sphingomonadales bacterium]